MPALTMDDGFIFNNKKSLSLLYKMQNSHQPFFFNLTFFSEGCLVVYDKGCVTNSITKGPIKWTITFLHLKNAL